jgi:uncharacterized protein
MTVSAQVDHGVPSPVDAGRLLDPATACAVRVFLDQINRKYQISESFLYGSRARGDFRPDSDADIAVVLNGAPGDRLAIAGEMADVAFDVMMDTGVLVEALPLWEPEFAHPETFRNPRLIENIRREGIRL